MEQAAIKTSTILLVEDEQILREMGILLFESMGFAALTARHGVEALEIYRKRCSEIDLVLLDLNMPVMGGVATYNELRKIAPELPLIICSGYGIDPVAELVEKDQYTGFVNKPFRLHEMREVMQEMLSQ